MCTMIPGSVTELKTGNDGPKTARTADGLTHASCRACCYSFATRSTFSAVRAVLA